MNSNFKKYIELAYDGNLDSISTSESFRQIMNGEVSDIQISAFLSLLQKTGIKAYHVTEALKVMKSKMISIQSPHSSMDTCGTGGDGKNSLNISTATAFVLAAYGIPIAKHGNRALTSNCGSADVLKELKINVDMDTNRLENCLTEVGICFMFAPNHHPAMKYVGQVRQQLGIKTIFNLLGPLLNPANVKNQIVGVFSKEVFEIYMKVFESEKKNVCLIAGYDGNDEISLDGTNLIFTSKCGIIEFDPNSLNIPRSIKEEITGKDAEFNAYRILEMFEGKKDSFYNAVCINSAFGIILNNNIEINKKNILDSFERAKSIIDGGKPLNLIKKLSIYTNS